MVAHTTLLEISCTGSYNSLNQGLNLHTVFEFFFVIYRGVSSCERMVPQFSNHLLRTIKLVALLFVLWLTVFCV